MCNRCRFGTWEGARGRGWPAGPCQDRSPDSLTGHTREDTIRASYSRWMASILVSMTRSNSVPAGGCEKPIPIVS